MKLKVGMYARTEKGTIFKVSSVNEVDIDGIWYKALMSDNVFKDILINPPFKFEIIEKASYNIIDLIEVGDYVNGYKVFEKDDYLWIERLDNHEIPHFTRLDYLDIKSIVTKEQFSQIQYKVGE